MKFTEVALALGVSGLIEKEFLVEKLLLDRDYNNEEYKAYSVTKSGIQWLQENKGILEVKEPESTGKGFEDDFPF